nr:ABC transporter permease [Shouchella shacheensis]
MFHQIGTLMPFILRRDRVRLPLWMIVLTLVTVLTASSFSGLYASDEERQGVAETMQNPAMVAMVGPSYGLDHYTEGPMLAHQMLLFTVIAAAIMNILIVTRHTRGDEEEGRTELLRSRPVGRLAGTGAVVAVLFAANGLLAGLMGAGLWALQIESIDAAGSFLYGTAIGATGFFFAAVTVFFAQLSESARGATGFSFAVLGVAYLLRAVGDLSNETLSMLSPLGWIVRTEAYVTNLWWPVVLTIGAALCIIVIAFSLHAIRDEGAGLFPSKRGRHEASFFLSGPLGLAVRLQRTALIAWAVGLFVLGVSYGSVFGDLESFFSSNETVAALLPPTEGYTLTEQFLAMVMSVIAMVCAIPAIMMIAKLKAEENKSRNEHLLAQAVSRTKMIGTYVGLALVTSVIMLSLAVSGLWSAALTVMDEAISFSTMAKAAAVYVPAIWLMVAVAALLVGWRPQLSSFIWLYLGYSFLVVYVGDILQIPEWMEKLSPFGHIPQLPVEDLNVAAVALVTVVAVALIVAGVIGYNKRDVAG